MGITYSAALGYAILSAKASGFEDYLIQDLVDNMVRAFDVRTETEAQELAVYETSKCKEGAQ